MRKHVITSLSLLVASQGLATSLQAKEDTSKLTDRQRIERLERMVESQGLVDLLIRLDSLQQEIQQLRGDSDVTAHTLKEIKKRQRDLYIDIDRRLLQLERGSAGRAPQAVNTAPATSVTTQPASTTAPASKVPAPVAAAATSPADEAREQQAYQKAFDLLRELRYAQAMDAFRQFIKDYPDGRYAHIAQYWLGEAGYAQGQFKTAIADYQALLDNYPKSPKRAQAMLKIGYSQDKLKDTAAAEKTFARVIQQFPGTTEAGQAEKMLKQIKSGKH